LPLVAGDNLCSIQEDRNVAIAYSDYIKQCLSLLGLGQSSRVTKLIIAQLRGAEVKAAA